MCVHVLDLSHSQFAHAVLRLVQEPKRSRWQHCVRSFQRRRGSAASRGRPKQMRFTCQAKTSRVRLHVAPLPQLAFGGVCVRCRREHVLGAELRGRRSRNYPLGLGAQRNSHTGFHELVEIGFCSSRQQMVHFVTCVVEFRDKRCNAHCSADCTEVARHRFLKVRLKWV